jgi:hypothetical protein
MRVSRYVLIAIVLVVLIISVSAVFRKDWALRIGSHRPELAYLGRKRGAPHDPQFIPSNGGIFECRTRLKVRIFLGAAPNLMQG